MKTDTAKKPLTMKDLAKLIAIFSAVIASAMGALTFIHAEMTIPKILNETSRQIERAVDRHANGRHKNALGREEFHMWSSEREKSVEKFGEQVLRRLDSIEATLRKR